jgi:hypothetical protein
MSRLTVAAADVMGSTVMAGVSSVSDRAGLGRLVPADEESTAAAQAVAAPPALRKGAKSVSRGAAANRVAPVAADDEASAGTLVAYHLALHLATGSATPAEQISTFESVVDTPIVPEVFTSASEGVTPPINVHQQLSPTVDLANLSRIEIVVAPDGSVESARLLDNRPDVLGGMFLSAVKTWRFHPALKDGVAVRYRKIIVVSFE